MGYLLYAVSFLFLMAGTLLYATRSRWFHLLPPNITEPFYSRIPTSFMSDVESGFTSNDFDLSGNVMDGDSRAGLDVRGKREVQRIMKNRGIGFDEARRVYMEQNFKKNNIGEDGLPRDPKFVSFS
ncbi:hypothetical protein EPUS_01064 [Endocarpon pusillum Z07020]|uniref:Uncharacterized protein n=1 Tax=Endocarpon pusillum (strain Z07020 / HMAS-L-300199) TaxID=1263415 RepID=U1GAS1_ENDPU|nr:uncharacterized protein EPUS_01064 [Endocarpon pusillum Z07020]ERF69108.1 hypothetical protein EPUS_01064 [Endocarpon pusillum Z07020]